MWIGALKFQFSMPMSCWFDAIVIDFHDPLVEGFPGKTSINLSSNPANGRYVTDVTHKRVKVDMV